MNFNTIVDAVLNAFFPPRCVFCGKVDSLQSGVCKSCRNKAEKIDGEVCIKCGREKTNCDCKGKSFYYDGICAPFVYSGVVRSGIHLFKFEDERRNGLVYAKFMADCVKKRFPEIDFDCVISVPMSKKEIRKHSFDQSAFLASAVAKELDIVYDNNILKKIYDTERQHLLNNLFRKGNLAGAFDVADRKKVDGKVILLCDDVSTTGGTLDECAKMLYLCGAKNVYCSVLALTNKEK